MCILRTLLLAFALCLPAMASGLPVAPAERAQAFAACAGIHAADATHAALSGGADADRAALRRVRFLELMDATLPPEGDARARAALVQARLAQRHLLETAAFSPSAQARRDAAEAAARRRARCDALMLGA
jgi:hypothetical protein